MFGGTWFESDLNIQFLLSFLHDELILDKNNLSGSVPSELFGLPNLWANGIWVGKWIW